jgi:hypothetical protein
MNVPNFSLILVSLLSLCWPLDSYSQAQPTATSASAPQSGGGGVDAAAANNPAAPLIQVQFQSWYHPAYDGTPGQGNDFMLRPIIPFDPKGIIPTSIVRVQVPLTSDPNGRTGLGDVQLLTVFFPGWHPGDVIKIGAGAVIEAPSATNRYAGQGKWQVGPDAVVIFTGVKNLVLGAILDNPIAVGGERNRPDVNALTLEPLVIKTFGKGYFFRFDPYWNFDWKKHGSATLPLNLGFGRLLKIRGQLVNAYIQPEFLARNEASPASHPPRVTLRFAMALVYPKKVAQQQP